MGNISPCRHPGVGWDPASRHQGVGWGMDLHRMGHPPIPAIQPHPGTPQSNVERSPLKSSSELKGEVSRDVAGSQVWRVLEETAG